MQLARFNRVPRAVAFAVLAALLTMTALGLSQCTMVGDNLTGVGLEKSDRAYCVNDCNRVYQAALDQAKKDCEGDQSCWEAAKAAAYEVKQNCIANCHHQGGGSAG